MEEQDGRATPTGTAAVRLARVGEIVEDVTDRLHGVCGHLPEAEYAELVRHIAELTAKYEDLTGVRASRPPRILPSL